MTCSHFGCGLLSFVPLKPSACCLWGTCSGSGPSSFSLVIPMLRCHSNANLPCLSSGKPFRFACSHSMLVLAFHPSLAREDSQEEKQTAQGEEKTTPSPLRAFSPLFPVGKVVFFLFLFFAFQKKPFSVYQKCISRHSSGMLGRVSHPLHAVTTL